MLRIYCVWAFAVSLLVALSRGSDVVSRDSKGIPFVDCDLTINKSLIFRAYSGKSSDDLLSSCMGRIAIRDSRDRVGTSGPVVGILGTDIGAVFVGTLNGNCKGKLA